MNVREVRLDEWRRFREIRLRALREDPAAFGRTHEEEAAMTDADWIARAQQPGTVRLVAEESESWLGIAGVWTPEEGPPEVFGMWVAPDARGRGAGLALLDACAAWARVGGAKRLALWVNVAQAPAVRLYARAGFAPEGPAEPGGRDPTRVFQRMVRAL